MKIIALAYIYQLIEFGDLMSCGSKDIFKNASGSFEIQKLEYLENGTKLFCEIKKFFNLCLR